MKKITTLLFQIILVISITAQTYTPITWGAQINAPGGGYPRMAEFSDGRLMLGMDTGEGTKIYESSDKGLNWTYKSTAVSTVGLPANYHIGNVFLYRITDQEWLCGYRHVNDHDAYTDVDDGINHYVLKVTKSTDGGLTWNFLSDIVETGSPSYDPSGRPGGVWEPFFFNIPQTSELLVFYAKEDARPGPGDTQDIICKRSYDNGATWSNEIIVANGSDYGSRDGMPEVILTPNNQLICVFEAHDDVNNNWFSIKTIRSDDFGLTWHTRTNVYSSPSSADYGAGAPYIAQLNDGRIFVCYQENLSSPNDDTQTKFGYVVSEDEGNTWSASTTLYDDGWWNSWFVDSDNTLYAMSSGVRIKKALFPVSQDEKYFFDIRAKHSNKSISTATAGSPSGDNILQQNYASGDNQQWAINDAGNGYFWLEPKSAPGKCLEISAWSTENAGNAIIWDYLGNANQLWYVKESPNGYYRIYNKNSHKVLDVQDALLTDGANIQQWADSIGTNQKFKAYSTNNATYTDPFIPYIKWDYVNLTNLNSSKVADVAVFNFIHGANIQQWDNLTGINQEWLVHDAEDGYVWLEPKLAIGQCLEVTAWGTANGDNIITWDYLGNDNQVWKPTEVSSGVYKFVNKHSGLSLEVTSGSSANGANIQQWDWLGTNSQQWGVNYTDPTYTAPNAIQPYVSSTVTAEIIDLFIVAGQSNALGFAGDADYYPADPNNYDPQIRFNWTDFGGLFTSGGWTTMGPQTALTTEVASGHRFGPEVSFARELTEAGHNTAIFKYTKGGTSIYYDWKTPGAGGWYDQMKVSLQSAITELTNQGHTVNIKAFVWVQGESDTYNATTADPYYNNLMSILNDLRASEPDISFILGVDEQFLLWEDPPARWWGIPSETKVLNAHMEISRNDDNCRFTSMYGLPKADATHLTPAGLITHGERIYDAYNVLETGGFNSETSIITSNADVVSYNRRNWIQSFVPETDGMLTSITFDSRTSVPSSASFVVRNGIDCNATTLYSKSLNSISVGDNTVLLDIPIKVYKGGNYSFNVYTDDGTTWQIFYNQVNQINGNLRTSKDASGDMACDEYFVFSSTTYNDWDWDCSIEISDNAIVIGTAGIPTGDAYVCTGTASTVYTTTGASNATSYVWNIAPTSAGTISSTTTTATVNWNTSYEGAVDITVYGTDGTNDGPISNALTVNLVNVVTPIITGNAIVCDGDAYLFTATNYNTDYGLLWNTGSEDVTITGIVPVNDYVLSLTVTDPVSTCFATSDDFNASVVELPIAYAGEDQIITTGENATITATGGTSYNWDNGLGAGYTHVVSPTINTTYLVTVTDGNSCSATDDVVITVNAVVIGTAGTPIGDAYVCTGATSTTYTTTGASNATSYVWSISPASAGSISSTTITATVNWNTSYEGTVDITVYGTDGINNGTISNALTVNLVNVVTPIITGNTTICEGETYLFTATNYNTDYNIMWSDGTSSNTMTGTYAVGNYTISLTITDAVSGCNAIDYEDLSVEVCTNTENELQLSNFSLFPNPTNSIFTIKGGILNGKIITVNNSIGELIYSKKLISNIHTVNVSELEPGIYFVRIDNVVIKLVKVK